MDTEGGLQIFKYSRLWRWRWHLKCELITSSERHSTTGRQWDNDGQFQTLLYSEQQVPLPWLLYTSLHQYLTHLLTHTHTHRRGMGERGGSGGGFQRSSTVATNGSSVIHSSVLASFPGHHLSQSSNISASVSALSESFFSSLRLLNCAIMRTMQYMLFLQVFFSYDLRTDPTACTCILTTAVQLRLLRKGPEISI